MSLRLRLFGLLGGLVALLIGAEWWLVRSLTRDLSGELEKVAASVGSQVVRFVATTQPDGGASDPVIVVRGTPPVAGAEPLPGGGTVVRVFPPGPERPDGTTTPAPGATGGKVEVRREVTWERQETESEGPAPSRKVIVSTLEVRSEAGTSSAASASASTPSRFLVLHGPKLAARIPIPETGVADAVDRFRRRLLLGSLGLFAAGLAVAGLAAHRISAPLRALSSAARSIAEGRLGEQVAERASGEVGEAIAAFNRMSGRLSDLEREALALRERQHLGELGDVGRGLAHALRNPLHSLGLAVDELVARTGEESEPIAESARRQIRSIDRSIRSFLSLASDGGAAERVDARTLVADVALSAAQDARGRVRVRVEEASAECPVLAIPAELSAAIQALVVNAVEASPDGATVTVAVAPLPEGVVVTVEDEGPGLPAEVRSRLFTPHVTTKPAGSGMGLFLAHRIATTRYGGSVALEDRSPHGCRATLTAPGRTGGADA